MSKIINILYRLEYFIENKVMVQFRVSTKVYIEYVSTILAPNRNAKCEYTQYTFFRFSQIFEQNVTAFLFAILNSFNKNNKSIYLKIKIESITSVSKFKNSTLLLLPYDIVQMYGMMATISILRSKMFYMFIKRTLNIYYYWWKLNLTQ